MQTFDCTLRLSGNVKMEVKKYDLPVSEIAVLRAIHGADAVFNLSPTGSVRLASTAREKERLVHIYGVRREQAERIEKLFPGLAPRLPTTLAQLTGEEPTGDAAEGEAEAPPPAIDIPDEPAEVEADKGDILDQDGADFSFLNRAAQQGEASQEAAQEQKEEASKVRKPRRRRAAEADGEPAGEALAEAKAE
jgi:hypothetical protein